MKWLIFGHHGWIGQQVLEILKQRYPSDTVIQSDIRVDNEKDLTTVLLAERPDRVLCLIGRTHGESCLTIDYLEQPGKILENIRDNLYAPITLAIICQRLDIHLTYMGTGCIFSNDETHNNRGFTEEDIPNYFDSGYSVVKGFTDRLMHLFEDSVLNVRIRMPITNRDHPRNFISKIIRYEKIINVANSMTVLDDLLPVMLEKKKKKKVGTINLTNPGTITHNQILDLYRELVDPSFTYKNCLMSQLRETLKAGRSNNQLDTTKLESEYPEVPSICNSVTNILKNWQK